MATSIVSRIHLRSTNQTYNVRELRHQYLVSSRYSIDKDDGGILDNQYLNMGVAYDDMSAIPTFVFEIRNLMMFGSVSCM